MIERSMKTTLEYSLPQESLTIRKHKHIRAVHLEFGIPNQAGARWGHDRLRILTSGIPGAHNNPPIGWVFLNFPYNLFQLIYSLSRVILLAVDILCTEMPPLEPIDRAQISLPSMPKPTFFEEIP